MDILVAYDIADTDGPGAACVSDKSPTYAKSMANACNSQSLSVAWRQNGSVV